MKRIEIQNLYGRSNDKYRRIKINVKRIATFIFELTQIPQFTNLYNKRGNLVFKNLYGLSHDEYRGFKPYGRQMKSIGDSKRSYGGYRGLKTYMDVYMMSIGNSKPIWTFT